MSSTGRNITLRPAESRDRDLLLDWANEPATRAASFHPELIAPAAHDRWFADHLASSNVGLWIGELYGRPIGQVRVVRTDSVNGEVSISVAAEARGRGLARPLLLAAMAAAERELQVTTFIAAVRPGNAPSLALFRGAGFGNESEGERNGIACLVLVSEASSRARPDGLLNVLITSASRKVPLVRAFVNAARSLGARVIAADVSPLAAALYEADEARIVPRSDEPGFVDALLEVCADARVGLIVPTRDEELPVLAAARDRFGAAGTLVLVSSPEAVDTCQDKASFNAAVQAAGLETPTTFLDAASAAFPAFVRPRRGKGGAGAVRVDDAAELAAALAVAGPDAIVQELVIAQEYTVDTFLDLDGSPITCVPRERIVIVAGESVVSRTVDDPALVEATLRLCAAIGLVGHVTVQAFRTPDRILFIEVNPRYGGAANLGFEAGARTPELAIRLARGERLEPRLGEYEAGLTMLRSASDRFLREGDLVQVDATASADPTARMSHPSAPDGQDLRWRAVVFDIDDTLYPEHQFVDGGFRAAAEVIGRAVDHDPEALVARLWALHVRHGRGRIFDTLLEELGWGDDRDLVLTALLAYRTHAPRLTAVDGMAGLLARLRTAGARLGILSDGQSAVQRRKLAALEPTLGWFDAVVMTDELGPGHAKPAPDGFRVACSLMGVSPADAVYVANDVRKDFRGAREAGLATIRFGPAPDEGGGVDMSTGTTDDSDHDADSVATLARILLGDDAGESAVTNP
jgi:carbamoyl-phosphate synthase large subunit